MIKHSLPDDIEDITKKTIGAFYNVYNKLGHGFLEKVYENSFILELQKFGLHGRRQVPIDVYYDKQKVGYYFADIIIENKIIVELKASEGIREEHQAQLLNYLRATKIEYGLLFNFGIKPSFKRKIWTNEFSK